MVVDGEEREKRKKGKKERTRNKNHVTSHHTQHWRTSLSFHLRLRSW